MLKIGALWSKKDRNEKPMFSGEIECPHCKKKTRILGFTNKYKTAENRQPNFNLYMPDEIQQPKSEPEPDEPYIPERDEKPQKSMAEEVEETIEEDDEKLPF